MPRSSTLINTTSGVTVWFSSTGADGYGTVMTSDTLYQMVLIQNSFHDVSYLYALDLFTGVQRFELETPAYEGSWSFRALVVSVPAALAFVYTDEVRLASLVLGRIAFACDALSLSMGDAAALATRAPLRAPLLQPLVCLRGQLRAESL